MFEVGDILVEREDSAYDVNDKLFIMILDLGWEYYSVYYIQDDKKAKMNKHYIHNYYVRAT